MEMTRRGLFGLAAGLVWKPQPAPKVSVIDLRNAAKELATFTTLAPMGDEFYFMVYPGIHKMTVSGWVELVA